MSENNLKARKWVPFWVIPVVVVMAIGTVWLRLSIIRTTYEINQTDKQIHNMQQEHEQAELKLTALRSPRRLEILARAKFGLQPARADQVIHVAKPSTLASVSRSLASAPPKERR